MRYTEEYQGPVAEVMPESGVQLADFEARAEQGRQAMARVLELFPAEDEGVLKAHADPFDTAIEAEVA